MTRFAPLLCTGLFILACAGCSQPGVSSSAASVAPPPPPPVAAPRTGQVCDGSTQSFLNAVKLLKANYNPAPGGGPYQPPSGTSPNWPQAISDDLKAAFTNAPPAFRQYLCGLNGIYINASACPGNDPGRCSGGGAFDGAWGFRSRAHGDLGFRYIAISAQLWPNGGPAPVLHDYETGVLRTFLPTGDTAAFSAGANPDKSWMTVLAALAHEAGHVAWAETVIPSVGGNYDFSGLIGCPAGDFFAGWAYNHGNPSHPHLTPKGRWRPFHNRDNAAGSALDHKAPPLLAAFDSPATADSALNQLYQASQPWASLFGAQTPDEDFVESYVMAVLTGYDPHTGSFAGPLTSLPLGIPTIGSTQDAAKDLVSGNKPALAKKLSCLGL